jgi:hypothetical protein
LLQPTPQRENESNEKFRERKRIANRTLRPRAIALVGPPGVQKSTSAREYVAKHIKAKISKLKKVVVLVPRLEFVMEWQREFAELGVEAMILRGRSHETCFEMEKVELVTACGFKVYDHLCKKCPHLGICPYTAAMEEEAPVWIAASNYLFFEQSVLKKADFIVVDERFSERGMVEDAERNSIPLSVLAQSSHHDDPLLQKRDEKRQKLHRALDLHKQRDRGGIDQDVSWEFSEPGLKSGEIAERGVLDKILHPRLVKLMQSRFSMRGVKRMLKSELVREIRHTQTMIRIWHELRTLRYLENYDQSNEASRSGRIMIEGYDEDDDEDRRLRRGHVKEHDALVWCGINHVTKQFDVPILLLNIEHEEDIVKAFIPHIEPATRVDVELSEHAKIVQVKGAPVSMTKLCNPRQRYGESEEEFNQRCMVVEQYRHQVLDFILAKWRWHGEPDDCVVFTYKDYDNWLKMKSRLPDAFRSNHFGNVSGTNDYCDVKLAFMVGRALPGPKAVEGAAGMLSGLQVESIVDPKKKFSWYDQAYEVIEPRHGDKSAMLQHTHPDRMANALLRSILSELLNTIGRIRPWGRTENNPVVAYMLLDERVPGLVGIDAVTRWEEPGPFNDMINAGLVLTSEVDLMKLWPETFTSERTTRRYVETLKVPDGWCHFSYRLEEQRGRGGRSKKGWYDPKRVSDAKAWLIERLGPLSAYEEDEK